MSLVYLITGPMFYFSVGVFVFGLVWRLSRWVLVRASRARTAIFPRPAPGRRLQRVVFDTIFFPQLIEVDRFLWGAAILFHGSLLGVLVGHLHLLAELPGGWEERVVSLADPVGLTLGILCSLGLGCLLFRRCRPAVKSISNITDYLLLLLILGVVITGVSLRFYPNGAFLADRDLVLQLLAFNPGGIGGMVDTFHGPLVLHAFSVNLLLICFPFSKLMHCIGAVFTNAMRRG